MDVDAFERTLQFCTAGTIVVVDMATCSPATRGWCLFEWDHTTKYHGFDGLHLTGMAAADRGKIVKEIDVEKAECFMDIDRQMILGKITEHHGSPKLFNANLKLQLLLDPPSYRVDRAQLALRSRDTAWDFGPVTAWLADEAAPRALCVLAGAGTGKSTVSAALLDRVLGGYAMTGVVTASHFLKHSDARRLDPVR